MNVSRNQLSKGNHPMMTKTRKSKALESLAEQEQACLRQIERCKQEIAQGTSPADNPGGSWHKSLQTAERLLAKYRKAIQTANNLSDNHPSLYTGNKTGAGTVESLAARLSEVSAWTPARVRAIREKHGWTQREAAEHAGVILRTWQRWEEPPEQSGARTPRGAVAKLLESLERGD